MKEIVGEVEENRNNMIILADILRFGYHNSSKD